MKFVSLLTFLLIPSFCLAITCDELQSPTQVREFLERSKDSNPILRRNVSTTLEISPCEKEACNSKNRKEQQKEVLHLLRIGDKSRVHFLEGSRSSQCLIQRGERLLGCAACSELANEACRSYPDSSVTRLQGTNIDSHDFSLLASESSTYSCNSLEKNPGFFKLEIGISGAQYDQVIAFFDEKREIPVTLNFFTDGILRKVYRTFPKYYLQIDDQWISTVLRVRSTQGNEKAFVAETLVYVQRDGNKYDLYLDSKNDPKLKNTNPSNLFITN